MKNPRSLVSLIVFVAIVFGFCNIGRADSLNAFDKLTHPLIDTFNQETINNISNSNLSYATGMTLLVNGNQSYPEKWKALEGATQTIFIKSISIENDETGDKLKKLLIRKAKDGVQVYLILDYMFSLPQLAANLSLEKSGIHLRYFNNPWTFRHLPMHREHSKYMIVDGQTVIMGGMNWGESYEGRGKFKDGSWRDTDIMFKGPQAQEIHSHFITYWNQLNSSKEQISNDVVQLPPLSHVTSLAEFTDKEDQSIKLATRFIEQSPILNGGRNVVTDYYLYAISKARHHIYWEGHTLSPTSELRDALIEAAKRGVDVRILTNSKMSSMNLALMGALGHNLRSSMKNAKKLIPHGIKVYLWNGQTAVHSKLFTVDGVVASVGSYNISPTAFKFYSESALIVYDTKFIGSVEAQFQRDIANATLMQMKQ